MAIVRVVIAGGHRNISVRSFLLAVQNSLRVLNDLDSAISGEPIGSLDWVVSNLSVGSLTVEVESRSRLVDKNFGPDVAKAFVRGLGQIEWEGITPPYLSETGMLSARRLIRLIGRDGAAGLVISDLSETVEVSAKAAANIEQLIPTRQRSIGAVEGRLEMISIHGRPRFVVYHGRTRKAVTCRFEAGQWLEQIKEALGRQVNVAGVVHSNAKGEPLRIELEEIRMLRKKDELPTTAEMSGRFPDLTGAMSTEKFLQEIRGG